MFRSSTTYPDAAGTILADCDESFVVEAPTLEKAIAAALQEAPGSEVVNTQELNRGGIGGFFAKSAFRIMVRHPKDRKVRPG